MTDRTNYLYVALDKDTREDDVQPLIEAIKQMRGVADVAMHVVSPNDWLAYTRLRVELQAAINALFSFSPDELALRKKQA
jgi:hypothetical protein